MKYLNFIHIPKVAGNSIKKFFVDLSGKSSEVNYKRIVTADQKVVIPNGFQFITYGHGMLPKYINELECYNFAFVRNPYERIVSAFFYIRAGGNQLAGEMEIAEEIRDWTFKKFLEAIRSRKLELEHFRTQSFYIKRYKQINFIGKYESLNEDFEVALKNIGIKTEKKLEKINSSAHFHYKSYLNEEVIRIINNLYEEDFNSFGYNYEL
jgi:uncharacterized FlaG/YvyC family protein